MNQRLIKDLFYPFKSERHLLSAAPGFWRAVLYLIISQMGAGILLGIAWAVMGREPGVSFLVAVPIAGLILFILLFHLHYRNVFQGFLSHFQMKQIGYLILLFPLFFICTSLFNFGITELLPLDDVVLKDTLGKHLHGDNLIWIGILLVINAPLTEELIFRGLILRGFTAKYGANWSIFLSALLFSLIHLNPAQIPNAFILGLILGVMMVKTGNILVPMLYHALNNAIPAGALIYAAQQGSESKMFQEQSLGISTGTALLGVFFGLLFLFLMLKWYLYLITDRGEVNASKEEIDRYLKAQLKGNIKPAQYTGRSFFAGSYQLFVDIKGRYGSQYDFLDFNILKKIASMDGISSYINKLLQGGRYMVLHQALYDQLTLSGEYGLQIQIINEQMELVNPECATPDGREQPNPQIFEKEY